MILFSCVSCFPAWLFPWVPILLVAAPPRCELCERKSLLTAERREVKDTLQAEPIGGMEYGAAFHESEQNAGGVNVAQPHFKQVALEYD